MYTEYGGGVFMKITFYSSTPEVLAEIGSRIKAARIAMPATQKEMAEMANLSLRTISNLESGKDVSFSIREGAITGMIGPNGAGKSTTFNMICGYYPPTEGKIFFRGEDITNKKAYDYT